MLTFDWPPRIIKNYEGEYRGGVVAEIVGADAAQERSLNREKSSGCTSLTRVWNTIGGYARFNLRLKTFETS